MALRSKEWFYKQCLGEIKSFGRFSHLAWDILEKGIGQHDSTRGHVTQAIGGCQKFFEKYPQHVKAIQATDPTKPFDITAHPKIHQDFKKWLVNKSGAYGRAAYGYSFTKQKSILTTNLGGKRTGGGGGNDEFKRVLRLMAEWI